MITVLTGIVDEKTELDTKAKALSEFIGNNPIFDTLDPDEQERLKVQNDVMWQYSEILGARIAAFPKAAPNGPTCNLRTPGLAPD